MSHHAPQMLHCLYGLLYVTELRSDNRGFIKRMLYTLSQHVSLPIIGNHKAYIIMTWIWFPRVQAYSGGLYSREAVNLFVHTIGRCYKYPVIIGVLFVTPIPLRWCHRPISSIHWRRLVKNIGWANQNIGGGQKVVKSDKCMGVSQLSGARSRAAPP